MRIETLWMLLFCGQGIFLRNNSSSKIIKSIVHGVVYGCELFSYLSWIRLRVCLYPQPRWNKIKWNWGWANSKGLDLFLSNSRKTWALRLIFSWAYSQLFRGLLFLWNVLFCIAVSSNKWHLCYNSILDMYMRGAIWELGGAVSENSALFGFSSGLSEWVCGAADKLLYAIRLLMTHYRRRGLYILYIHYSTVQWHTVHYILCDASCIRYGL